VPLSQALRHHRVAASTALAPSTVGEYPQSLYI